MNTSSVFLTKGRSVSAPKLSVSAPKLEEVPTEVLLPENQDPILAPVPYQRANAAHLQQVKLIQSGRIGGAPLDRDSHAGTDFFTPRGLAAVGAREPHIQHLNLSRMNLAVLLSRAYRPGAELMSLVTWVRLDENGVASGLCPVEGLGRPMDTASVGMLIVGYTGDRIVRQTTDRGPQAVAVLARLRYAPDGSLVALPETVRDLTWLNNGDGCEARPDIKREAELFAAMMLAGFNLVEEVSRYDDVTRAIEPWDRGREEGEPSTGPLVVGIVDGPPSADGAPSSATPVASRYRGVAPMYATDGVELRALSFAHLAHGSVVRGRPYTYPEAFPWAIVPGCVKYAGETINGETFPVIRAGDVRYQVTPIV